MRYLGTLMLLACVAMLLFPSFWEGRHNPSPGLGEAARAPVAGRSTLTGEDLVPPWRGPEPSGDQDG